MTRIRLIELNKHILPYLKMAQEEAKKSPCVRRQFGAVIVSPSTAIPYHVAQYNQRVSQCCKGICARDRAQVRNGERVEVGAEIHAETAAIIDYNPPNGERGILVLAGYSGERELLSTEVWPCHTCAVNLKFTGIRYVYMKNLDNVLAPVSIAEVLEYRESEWVPDV